MSYKTLFIPLIFLLSLSLRAQEYHVVKDRDSLMTISNLYYQTHQCWKGILKANPKLKNPDRLEKGQELFIPPLTSCSKSPLWKNAKRKFSKKEIQKPKKKTIKKVIPKKVKQRNLRAGYAFKKHRNDFILYNEDNRPYRGLPKNKNPIFQSSNTLYKPISKSPEVPSLVKKKIKKNYYQIQFASYDNNQEAHDLVKELRKYDIEAQVEKALLDSGATWFRVRSDYFKSRKSAKQFAKDKQIPYIQSDYIILKSSRR